MVFPAFVSSLHLLFVLGNGLAGAEDALAGLLLASVWQGAVLALLVALGLRLLPGVSAATRSAIWTAVLLLILLSPALAWLVSASAAMSDAMNHAAPVHLAEGLSSTLILLWAAASAWRGAQLARGALRLRRLLRDAQPAPASNAITALLAGAARPASLCTSPGVDRPSVAGFFRPRILLPPTLLASLTEAELSQVVLHELEHLRRRDDWTNLLQQLALVALPLHPVLLWLDRQMAQERELACDDGVLAITRARKAYAACLAHVAESSFLGRGVSLALGALGGFRRRSELAARVDRILRAGEPTPSRTHSRMAAGIVLAGALAAAGLLARSPRLVTFVPATVNNTGTAESAGAVPSPISPIPGAPRTELAKTALPSPSLRTTVFQYSAVARSSHRADRRPVLRQIHFRRPQPPMMRSATPVDALQGVRSRQLGYSPTQRSASWFVFTAWQATESGAGNGADILAAGHAQPAVLTAFRHIPAAAARPQVWYTAVPFGDGWLVVQL